MSMESTIELVTCHGYENINKINDENMNVIIDNDHDITMSQYL